MSRTFKQFLLPAVLAVYGFSNIHMHSEKFVSNPNLKTIKDTNNWKGTPLDTKGRFVNHEFPFEPYFSEVWKWQTTRNPQKAEKKNDTFRLQVVTDTSFLHNSENAIVWLGHASFFIRINGVSMLCDPVLFNVGALLNRQSAFPFDPNLLKNIDYILLSHDHRDHMDEKSLQFLHQNNPDAVFLCGLKMDAWLNKMLKKPVVETAGWYQQFSRSKNKVNVYFLPARHWSRRGLYDTNQHLWGAFFIECEGKRIYFSGDTGYGSHLQEVDELFGPVDVCIIGVGAYKPEWFMNSNHISPQDAVKASNEMQAKHFIPMHYGTFDLSDEPLGEPYRLLHQLKAGGILKAELNALQVGRAFSF